MQLSPSQRELERGLPLIIKQPFANARGVEENMWNLVRSVTDKGKHKHVLNKDQLTILTSTFLLGLYQQILTTRYRS